jgi:glycosyltransferase involved in cell wall biosynthesis
MYKVDIGVFAHNEAHQIADMIAGLMSQDVFEIDTYSVRVLILANGCNDHTAQTARDCSQAYSDTGLFEVFDLAKGGKSRTWNTFVHELSRPDADILVFCDADAQMPNPQNISSMLSLLVNDQELRASTSRPTKDIAYYAKDLSFMEKIISKSGGNLYNWRNSIAGSLYALPINVARSFHLPIGLPVEDGFVRAMVATQCFADIAGDAKIDGKEGVFHIYESERNISTLIRHQTRLVIGSAINSAVFGHLNDLKDNSISEELRNAAGDEDWLRHVLAERLPNRTFGWVPWSFLYKRLKFNIIKQKKKISIKLLGTLVLGLTFDAIVYVNAQIKMARGAGVGYW